MSNLEKEKYLKEWFWKVSFSDEYGFDVWTHSRWPNMKYKLDKAFDVMKSNEPSLEPILTANLDNTEEMNQVRDLLSKTIDPIGYKKKETIKALAGKLGVDDINEFSKQFD